MLADIVSETSTPMPCLEEVLDSSDLCTKISQASEGEIGPLLRSSRITNDGMLVSRETLKLSMRIEPRRKEQQRIGQRCLSNSD